MTDTHSHTINNFTHYGFCFLNIYLLGFFFTLILVAFFSLTINFLLKKKVIVTLNWVPNPLQLSMQPQRTVWEIGWSRSAYPNLGWSRSLTWNLLKFSINCCDQPKFEWIDCESQPSSAVAEDPDPLDCGMKLHCKLLKSGFIYMIDFPCLRCLPTFVRSNSFLCLWVRLILKHFQRSQLTPMPCFHHKET